MRLDKYNFTLMVFQNEILTKKALGYGGEYQLISQVLFSNSTDALGKYQKITRNTSKLLTTLQKDEYI